MSITGIKAYAKGVRAVVTTPEGRSLLASTGTAIGRHFAVRARYMLAVAVTAVEEELARPMFAKQAAA
jgi:hypothetical protein